MTPSTVTSTNNNTQIGAKQNLPGYAIRPPPIDLLSSTTKSSLNNRIKTSDEKDHYDSYDDSKTITTQSSNNKQHQQRDNDNYTNNYNKQQ